ncbi:MAG TPA: BatA and WFA domain-containing protein [Phycisphaerae bacterium]|nr:BatA and WFA domain-containing protein [Phycisphaerae bacterium]
MNFLSGWMPIALAAGITVPPLVLLYFLKLRRAPHTVSTTLLWKRAVEDLQVNAPFQRIRNNLLMWLQLLILLLAAVALGKPIFEGSRQTEDTLVLLIDHSASMGVEEKDGRTRLDIAKEQAEAIIDNLPSGGKAMVIGFSDRATVASAFETDRSVLKDRLDSIPQTDAATTLTEGIALAEAYMQNLVIAGDQAGTDITVESSATPARVVVLTDGNIEDAESLTIKRLPTDDMQIVSIGERDDNVAILSMEAKRNYEYPQMLEVFSLVRNFGPDTVKCDANLYINNKHVDVQTMELLPGYTQTPVNENSGEDKGESNNPPPASPVKNRIPPTGSTASVAFDPIEYEGGGVVEVRLTVHDAMTSDNAAWTIVQPPRHVTVLEIGEGNLFLDRVLPTLPIQVKKMTPDEYERADESELAEAGRLKFDLAIFDNHSTERLWPGSYIFFGGVPKVEGVSADRMVQGGVIFDWDESHPILRYVGIGKIMVHQWLNLQLPQQAEPLVEGEDAPIMALLSQDGMHFLISAFSLVAEDEITGQALLNSDWGFKPHFPVFLQNAIQFMTGSLSFKGVRNVRPGNPIEFAVPEGTDEISVRRPDGFVAKVQTASFTTVNYAGTRKVGVYTAKPAIEGREQYAVNLFNGVESSIAPSKVLRLAGTNVEAKASTEIVNKPFWPYLLLAILAVLLIEWAIYSKRVFV